MLKAYREDGTTQWHKMSIALVRQAYMHSKEDTAISFDVPMFLVSEGRWWHRTNLEKWAMPATRHVQMANSTGAAYLMDSYVLIECNCRLLFQSILDPAMPQLQEQSNLPELKPQLCQ